VNLNDNLPDSWALTALDQVAYIEMGQSPDSRFYNAEGTGLPFFQGKAEFGIRFPEVRKWCSEPTKIAEAGDVLLSIRAPVGPTNIAQVCSCIGRGLAAIRAEKGVNQLYLFYFFRHIESWLSEQGTGSTFAAISGQFVKQIEFALAPTEEQLRIVEKLEELFSDLDAGVAELKAAQKKLAQYRQSLLKAAVEGSLTAEWRTKNTPKETGAQLLERILKERRTRWEEKQLARFKEQGKTPPKGWQDKYPEPVQPDTTNLPELPGGWVWASLDQFFCELRSGTAETSGRQTTPYPVLKSSAVRQGKIDFQALNYLQQKQSTRAENYLATGDVLITRLSGSVEYVGCCAVVQDVPTQGVQFPDRIFQGKLAPSFMWLGDYLAYCFQSAYVRIIIESAAKSTAGHKRISLNDLYPLPIPLPPAVEIKSIIQQLYSGIERAEAGEIAIIHSLTQAAAQRKNILKSAFSGQLVLQDPNDEPASLLLERIRAERQKGESSTKKRSSRKKVAKL